MLESEKILPKEDRLPIDNFIKLCTIIPRHNHIVEYLQRLTRALEAAEKEAVLLQEILNMEEIPYGTSD